MGLGCLRALASSNGNNKDAQRKLTPTMLTKDISRFENSVDPDQLASERSVDQHLYCFNFASTSTAKAGYDIIGSKSRSTAYILSTAMAKNAVQAYFSVSLY